MEFNPFDNISDDEDYDNNILNEKLPWIEKYRPKNLSDITSHDKIMKSLQVFIKDNSLPHTLFYGPPGTGKTSTIQAYAKKIYGSSYNFMVMEINASEDRGIDLVRSKIKSFAKSSNYFQKLSSNTNTFKLVILDEVDAMTEDGQAILRHVIDNYSYNTRFCLICNYIKKINQSLQSRCICFKFSPIPDKDMKIVLDKIIKSEKLTLTKSGKEAIISRSNGDLRKLLNNLQSISMIYDKIDETKINKCFNYPRKKQIIEIFDTLINKSLLDGYSIIKNTIDNNGFSLSDIIFEIYLYLKNIIVNKDFNKLSLNSASNIITNLKSIEVNQSINSSDSIQIYGVVSCFKL